MKEAVELFWIKLYIYALERMSEPSTLRGIAMIIMGTAAATNPDKLANILMIGSLVVGALGVVTPDSWLQKAKHKADSLRGDRQ